MWETLLKRPGFATVSRAAQALRRLRGPTHVVKKPKISVVVIAYNIPRELERTLISLSAGYQRNISIEDFEVIVVDNGSNPPVEKRIVDQCGSNFSLMRIDQALPSPAAAGNRGIATARGDVIGVMIDGARLASPGMLHFASHGACLYEHAIVGALGWYLGHDYQRWAVQSGYNHEEEDRLLTTIAWPADGYRLFEVSTMDESSVDGWLAPIPELNALFAKRSSWNVLNGFDERFDLPGGGLVNHDLLCRAAALPQAQLVLMLGEATFHQLHGGIATNSTSDEATKNWGIWAAQYQQITGRPYALPTFANPRTYIGVLPRIALTRLIRAAMHPADLYINTDPLGRGFDQALWTHEHAPVSPDDVVARLVELAHERFDERDYATTAAICRIIRARDLQQPEATRLLSLTSPWLPTDLIRPPRTEASYLALGDAYKLVGNESAAVTQYRGALQVNSHSGVAREKLFGPT